MTDLRQAAMQALEELDKLAKLGNGNQDGNSLGNTIAQEAREHLFTALAQPQQEPVAWQYKTAEAGIFVSDQLPQDVQVWQDIEWSIPLYTTPPQRPWVGLTEEVIWEIWHRMPKDGAITVTAFARAIEAAHGIKEGT